MPPDAFHRIAVDPVFAGLRSLSLTGNAREAAAWRGLFHSTTLTGVRRFQVPVAQLGEYAGSPLASRVLDLSVLSSGDMDQDMGSDPAPWLRLIRTAPPPRRLTLQCQNPGKAVFAEMRRSGWLRELRSLSVSGDSQWEVFSGRTAGLRSLFRGKATPKLTSLRLHEACDARVLERLSGWGGLRRLESLKLTDDYHGRLWARRFEPKHPPERLRTLEGVVLVTPDDLDRFLALPRLDRIARLKLSFSGEYDRVSGGYTAVLTADAAEGLVRSGRLAGVTDLDLGFNQMRQAKDRLAAVLADPAVMPRLRRLVFHGDFGGQRPSFDGLRARFGPRLQAW